ncbi:MAG TPA: asparagine synthase (glutamine-hydrolyzing) [Candidatus Polarisedimenticolia bacterium]|nr:asparagine synthase (glutamine-hydrolyzing) [Candidatus Polarisedimenticolia bacterium]
MAPGLVAGMCEALRHRGPDDQGIATGSGAAIGMRRLSIIDPEHGHQPVANEDGTVVAVLNGEIYNYEELRERLQRRGHVLQTHSDTETLVHLYEDHGAGLVEHLRGMYAFAVWDENRRSLLLGRDRLGVKPLYYLEEGRRLSFASELKALLRLPWVKPEIEWPSVAHLFTFLTTPATRSIVRGVRKLPPGHVLLAGPGQPAWVAPYWEVRFAPDRSRPAAARVEELRTLLDESIKLRLVSDVPVGAFLSGGLDSSAVVAMMARHVAGPIRTFTIGFHEAEFDERPAARLVARAFGTDHHEMLLDPDLASEIETIAWHLDEPFGDSSAIPTYMVSKLASRHVKVVLTGDGGDEVFAGYDRYVVEAKRRRLRLPAALRGPLGRLAAALPPQARGRNFLHSLSLSGPARYLDAGTLLRRDALQRLFRPEAWQAMTRDDPETERFAMLERWGEDWLGAAQALDLKSSLPLDILTKVDRMSMAHSVEAREPLLDHKLIEWAATLPPEFRLHGTQTKWIFRRAIEGLVPGKILSLPKRGFGVPLGRWFRGGMEGILYDLLLSRRSRERGIFEPAEIQRLIDAHGRGRPLDLELWTLMSFELWCRVFQDTRPGRMQVESCA